MSKRVSLEEFRQSAEFQLCQINDSYELVVADVTAKADSLMAADIKIEPLSDKSPEPTKSINLEEPQGFGRCYASESAFTNRADGGLQDAVKGEVVQLTFMDRVARETPSYDDGDVYPMTVAPDPTYERKSVICFKIS